MAIKNGEARYGYRHGNQMTTDGPVDDPDGRYGVPRMKKSEVRPRDRRDPREVDLTDNQ